jgi:hypothetical protein
MSSLTRYNVASGEQIRVRASAYNINGWSTQSAFNTGVALMQATTPDMQTPTAVKTKSNITISWTPFNAATNNNARFGANAGYDYELWWNNGRTSSRGIVWILLNETKGTTFTTNTKIDITREYFFKVRAKTTCGMGRFSSVRAVSYLTVPCQMEPPKTVINGCQVNITWIAPCNGGTQILSYKVDLLISQGNGNTNARYISLSNCSSGRTFSCTIPMTTLAGSGYNLRNGTKIIARAAACN